MNEIFDLFGRAVCHRLPGRSFMFGDMAFPICARCMGMYTGFLISFLFLAVKKRFKGNKPFTVFQTVLLLIGFTVMSADIFTSYFGFRETTNAIRYITGSLFAFSLPFFITLIKNFSIDGQNTDTIVYTRELLQLLPAVLLPLVLYNSGFYFAYFAGGIIATAAIYLAFYCVSYVVVAMLLRFKGTKQKVMCAVLPLVVIFVLSGFYNLY